MFAEKKKNALIAMLVSSRERTSEGRIELYVCWIDKEGASLLRIPFVVHH